MVHFGNSWDEVLKGEFDKEYYLKLREFLKFEYSHYVIYPKMENIFNALKTTSYEDAKVCILGQDPYHEPNQAHGLAFSVEQGVALPRSLINIYKEISSELNVTMSSTNGNLTKWAKQGILLLNTVLTVRKGQANSHKGKGWETFTDDVIKKLNEREDPVIFVLWGNNAKTKEALITNKRHYILKSPHPSPLSASYGFFGNGHFKKINEILIEEKKDPIDWTL